MNDYSYNVLSIDDERVLLGSLARVTGKGIGVGVDSTLPDWLERGVESVLRDAEDEAPKAAAPTAISSASSQQSRIVGMGNNGSSPARHMHQKSGGASPAIVLTPTGATTPTGAQKGAFMDLDTFYADAEDAEEEESEEEEEEEEGSEEEGEEDDEEGEEEGDGDEEEESEDDNGGDGHRDGNGESDADSGAGESKQSRASSGSRGSPGVGQLGRDAAGLNLRS